MKTKLLLLSLLLGGTLAASAINPHRVQRIDREIQKHVFIPKGQVLAGGLVSYS